MDYLQWMGAVRMRVQTADKNITIIHTTPVHQLTSCEVKKKCVYKKQFLFNLKLLYPLKKILSEWGEKYAQIKHCLQAKRVLNTNKQICWQILMWEDNRVWTFTGGSIIDYFDQKQWFKAKTY